MATKVRGPEIDMSPEALRGRTWRYVAGSGVVENSRNRYAKIKAARPYHIALPGRPTRWNEGRTALCGKVEPSGGWQFHGAVVAGHKWDVPNQYHSHLVHHEDRTEEICLGCLEAWDALAPEVQFPPQVVQMLYRMPNPKQGTEDKIPGSVRLFSDGAVFGLTQEGIDAWYAAHKGERMDVEQGDGWTRLGEGLDRREFVARYGSQGYRLPSMAVEMYAGRGLYWLIAEDDVLKRPMDMQGSWVRSSVSAAEVLEMASQGHLVAVSFKGLRRV